MDREHTLYNSNYFKFVKICFMIQDMIYLVNVPCALEKNVHSLLLGQVFKQVNIVVQVFHSLPDFSLLLLSITVRGMPKSSRMTVI